ncbi:MAG: diguanylate cyclase [Armatimonadetes bacterium]|nr:diguanylate cyclase [Armatimonadota bacterium]
MSSAIPHSERRRFDAVRQMVVIAASEPTIETFSERISELVREHTAAREVMLCLRDRNSHDLRHVANSGHLGVERHCKCGDPVSIVFEEAQLVTCHSEETDPAIRTLMPTIDFFTFVPMIRFGKSIGVLIVGSDSPLPDQDVELIHTLAQTAVLTLPGLDSSSRALENIRFAADKISRLSPFADLKTIKDTIVAAAVKALETDLVALFTIDPCHGGVECQHTAAVSQKLSDTFWNLFSNRVTDRRFAGAWVETYSDGENSVSNSKPQIIFQDFGIRAILVCPIRSESGASGALVAFYKSEIDSVDAHAAIIESIAAQATATISYALAIEQSRCLLDDLAGANQELSVQATCDGLTGLPNHRTLQQRLSELCRASTSAGDRRIFSMVMIDVDHFKFYNDAHGHQEGDAALRAVGRIIASGLRQNDFAARYGGEEFALVLTDVGKAAAVGIAERIRQAIAQHAFPKGRLTVSIGVSEYPSDGSTPGEIIERSDRALYHAKITGRNRVVAWGSTGALADQDKEAKGRKRPKRSVLIAELEPSLGGSLCEMLPRDSYKVEKAKGIDKVAEFLKTRRYDIVLVSGSGSTEDYKCLSTIAAIHPNLPIVLLTDDLSIECSRDALRSGASDVYSRPTSSSELPLLIERNLERTRVEKERLAERSTGVMLQAIDALVAAIDAKDPFMAGHSKRVTSLALAISDNLEISSDERWALELAAKLHDIGKIGLPDSALNKQSPLTDEEWRAMREHPALGSRIVGAIDELSYVSNIIRHHHERLDGSGYPDGLKGEAIPYLAQIIAVADAYEAMTSERAYRSPLSPQEAIEELRLHAGSYYDTAIVEALADLVSESAEDFGAADAAA